MSQLPEECFVLQKEAAFRPKAPQLRPRPGVSPPRQQATPKPTLGGVASGLMSRVPKPLVYGPAGGYGLYEIGQYLAGQVSDAQNQAAPNSGNAEDMAETLEERQRRLRLGR